MKRCVAKTFFSTKLLFLFFLPFAVKMEGEDEYCRPDNKISMHYHLKHKDVCPLIENVFFETVFDILDECAVKCLEDVFCAGYNFAEKRKNKKSNCQLTQKLDHEFHYCKKDDKSWDFYQAITPRKVPCREMKSCKNGGKTIIDVKGGPGSDPYRCECSKGYKGDLCEIEPGLQFLNSTILSGEPAAFPDQIKNWSPRGKTKATICWRATRDGWAASAFHSRCDYKVPTLIIVKVGNYIFGGYANASWDGGVYKKAPGSFMFSLRNKENLPPFKAPLKDENIGSAIYAGTGYGPTFGSSHDLHISNNADSNTYSYTKFNHVYQAPSGVSSTSTILAGTSYFTPSEVEMFYLV